ncbi:MAG: methyltransferase [Candidatus Woesearchaeota archaeon]
MPVYMPREDSLLLKDFVKLFAKGKVLDVGTGSGILAVAASENKKVRSVTAVDIDRESIDFCNKTIKNKKIKFKKSDIFSDVKGIFDTIIFNPPYLPEDRFEKDISVIGGKKGYETIEKFLNNANEHLSRNGIILLLFSSLTKKNKIEEIINNNLFVYEQLAEEKVGPFENLYVYLIKKSDFLKVLERIGLKNVKRFAKGRRGIIYTGKYKNNNVAIKIQRKDIPIATINKEARIIKKLNKQKIGPKFLFAGKNFFVYRFVEGDFIEDFIKKTKDKKLINKVFKDLLKQCKTLDILKINKEEMHRPMKHIIITKNNKAVLIDFERCRKTESPKNVSQFCHYLTSERMEDLLRGKGIMIDKNKIIGLVQKYKKSFGNQDFKDILLMVK